MAIVCVARAACLSENVCLHVAAALTRAVCEESLSLSLSLAAAAVAVAVVVGLRFCVAGQ